jgi:hypothetical protein
VKISRKIPNRRKQSGVALLISIFVLLLISVIAIAMIVSSGTESALAGNYRSATNVYYAALAGLEEGRGRLLPKNPNYLGGSLAALGSPLTVGKVLYILNPASGETVNPTDTATPATYPDTEYSMEFVAPPPSGASTISSASAIAGLPGPLYKWVRINGVTEQSLNIDVNNDSFKDPATMLFYDAAHLDSSGNPRPSLIVNSAPPPTAVQALEITALAVLPNGSQKLLQYVVAPIPLLQNLTFPAALTLNGNGVSFTGPGTPQFNVNGNDQFAVGACAPSLTPYYAVGYTDSGDGAGVSTSTTPAGKYQGLGGTSTTPSVGPATLPAGFQTPSQLDKLVQNITQGADTVLTGPANSSNLPSGMSAGNPMTVVVNGDLDLTGWHGTGYGLLVVTGNFIYDPNASWKGAVLVVGQGVFNSTLAGTGEIDGALLIAKTRDSSGVLLPDPNLGAASFSQTGGGNGIYYSSCWARAAQAAPSYKILSFREIPQP